MPSNHQTLPSASSLTNFLDLSTHPSTVPDFTSQRDYHIAHLLMAPATETKSEYVYLRNTMANADCTSPAYKAARSLEMLGYKTDPVSRMSLYSCNTKVYMCSSQFTFEDFLTVLVVGYKDEPSGARSYVYAVRSTSSTGESDTFVHREKDVVTAPDHPIGSTLVFCVGGIRLPVRVAEVHLEGKDWMYRFAGSDEWRTQAKINDVLDQ